MTKISDVIKRRPIAVEKITANDNISKYIADDE